MRFSSQSSMRIQVAFCGHLDLEQLLDREHEDELVVLERDVVDALRVRDRLPPRLLLHVLLEAGVQVADHRGAGRRRSRRQVDDEPQHAVRGRVVRAEVDRQDVVGRRAAPAGSRAPSGSGSGCACLRRSRPRSARDASLVSSENRTGSPPIG